MPGECFDWSTVIRDADGFPVAFGHIGGDIVLQVAAPAPRGIVRISPEVQPEFAVALAEAAGRATAARKAAQGERS